MSKHLEEIICPNCDARQVGEVWHTGPYWTYVHICDQCDYAILESEWEKFCEAIPPSPGTGIDEA